MLMNKQNREGFARVSFQSFQTFRLVKDASVT